MCVVLHAGALENCRITACLLMSRHCADCKRLQYCLGLSRHAVHTRQHGRSCLLAHYHDCHQCCQQLQWQQQVSACRTGVGQHGHQATMPVVYVFRVCLYPRPAIAHSFADCIADLSARISTSMTRGAAQTKLAWQTMFTNNTMPCFAC